MTKNIIFVLILLFYNFTQPLVFAMEPKKNQRNSNNNKSKIKILSTPNWVHPNLRESHKGYAKFKEQKQMSHLWQYSTNRQSGNIKGGGTTNYNDYTPFYHPSQRHIKEE
jgi:hypothetical protein